MKLNESALTFIEFNARETERDRLSDVGRRGENGCQTVHIGRILPLGACCLQGGWARKQQQQQWQQLCSHY